MRRTLVAGALVLVAGCASVIGLGDFELVDDAADGSVDGNSSVPDTNAVDVAPVADAADEAPVVVPPVTCAADAGACDAIDLDGGWRPIAMTPGTATCPAGFGEAVITRGMPSAGPGACDCTATTTPPTSCTGNGAVVSFLDGDQAGACNTTSASTFAAPAGCATSNGAFFGHEYAALVPVAASGATCTAKSVADPTKATTQAVTLCPPIGSCNDTICAGGSLAPLRDCIVADGDLACPKGPFTDKIPVGAGVGAITCSDCTCTVTSQTCGGIFTGYISGANCTGASFVIPAGVCTDVAHAPCSSHRYTPNASATAVADGGKTITSATFAGPRTLCCVP